MVSPGFGNCSVKVVRSMFALPTTAIRGRLAITFRLMSRTGEFSQRVPECQTTQVAGWRLKEVAVAIEFELFSVRHPDVFNLCGVLEEPTALCLFRIEPVDRPSFVGENLF